MTYHFKLKLTYAVGRASNIELLMLVSDFIVKPKLKTLKGISTEYMEYLNENVKKEKTGQILYIRAGMIKLLPVLNHLIIMYECY